MTCLWNWGFFPLQLNSARPLFGAVPAPEVKSSIQIHHDCKSFDSALNQHSGTETGKDTKLWTYAFTIRNYISHNPLLDWSLTERDISVTPKDCGYYSIFGYVINFLFYRSIKHRFTLRRLLVRLAWIWLTIKSTMEKMDRIIPPEPHCWPLN